MNSVFSRDALLTHPEHYDVEAAHVNAERCQTSRVAGCLTFPSLIISPSGLGRFRRRKSVPKVEI